jgi:tetratricopeptide (TPR) repeat protein
MRDFEALYHEMSPEEVEEAVVELSGKAFVDPQTGRSPQEIELLFEYMHGLTTLARHGEAGKVFNALRGIIDDFRQRTSDSTDSLQYFYEWSLLALKLTPESRNAFVSMPLYHELLETFDHGPAELRYRGVQARTQLLRHLEFWLGKDGSLDVLSEEDRDFIRAAREDYEGLHEAALEDCEERGDFLAVVRLYRNAAQYYLLLAKPNDAIVSLKEAIEYLPDTPEYHEADKADLLMQIGQIFVGYKKFQPALKYFEQAREIYESGGEDLEMLAYQAEGWIDEVRKKL